MKQSYIGQNLSIICKPNGEILYASRSKQLGSLSEIKGLSDAIEKYKKEILTMSDYAIRQKKIIQFYFEYYGNGIIGKINYGPTKNIAIIGLTINGEIKSQAFLYNLVEELQLQHILIPILGYANGLDEALNWNENFITTIFPEGGSEEEGIVIKPLNSVYISPSGDIFYLKKKNKKYLEIDKKKVVDVKEDIPENIKTVCVDICTYATESRMLGVFSKEGKIPENQKDIGYFLKKIIEDIKCDYLKNNNEIDKIHEKYVNSILSKEISILLIQYLNKLNE